MSHFNLHSPLMKYSHSPSIFDTFLQDTSRKQIALSFYYLLLQLFIDAKPERNPSSCEEKECVL